MKGFVYILRSIKDKRTYTRSTPDLERRVAEHNSEKCFTTKKRRPLKLVYFEELPSIQDARRREKYFKTASGRRKLREIFTV
jgi:putative endonuclease